MENEKLLKPFHVSVQILLYLDKLKLSLLVSYFFLNKFLIVKTLIGVKKSFGSSTPINPSKDFNPRHFIVLNNDLQPCKVDDQPNLCLNVKQRVTRRSLPMSQPPLSLNKAKLHYRTSNQN